jgi:hypothetical protein
MNNTTKIIRENKELRFQLGDFFPENNVVGRWTIVLSIIMNDLILSCKLLTDSEQSDALATAKRFYYFRLGCSHLREAIKWLFDTSVNSDIKEFIESFNEETSIHFQKIKCLSVPFEGSFAKKILKPVRDNFFHYPKLDNRTLHDALKGLRAHQMAVSFETGSLSDTRFLYADDLNVAMFWNNFDGEHELESACKKLTEAICNFIDFGNNVLDAYSERCGYTIHQDDS